MRRATLAVVLLGLLSFGAALAVTNERPANAPATPRFVATADNAAVTPLRQSTYQPVARWYRNYYYHDHPRYYSYRPRYDDRYRPPRYYYYDPYSGFYYHDPYSFGFEFRGPRKSFSFGF